MVVKEANKLVPVFSIGLVGNVVKETGLRGAVLFNVRIAVMIGEAIGVGV